jgi:Holliday junction DNA helicase RuvA
VRILGIDPGSNTTGFGVIERRGAAVVHLAHGVIRSRGEGLPARLGHLYAAMLDVIERHRPEVAAVEQVFVAASPRSALVLGQARGVVLSALGSAGLAVREYSAAEVKQAVTGQGRAGRGRRARGGPAPGAERQARGRGRRERPAPAGAAAPGAPGEAGPLIAWLEGVLREQRPTRVIVDVGGVGYEVHVPLSTFTVLPDLGKTVGLHVHTHATEGALQLFGFGSQAELVAFELLLRANRVGPRLAQTVLSGISPAELCEAIRSQNVGALRSVPGIGSKMAERILLELRDRLDELDAVTSGSAPRRAPPSAADTAHDQTLSALLNLGYSRGDAERVLADAAAEAGSDATLETLVRESLKRLAR